MYQDILHSPTRPFRATPDLEFYFPSESIESARQTAVRASVRAEGPVLILGGTGLGKSLLAQVIANDLAARFDLVMLHAAHLCSRRALLQNILFELDMPYKDLSEGELRLSILDRLVPSPETAPDGVLILVDEAHTLPTKLLEELRLITNFTRNNQPRARLILLGSLRLEDAFTHPQLDSLNQRLAARCYLQPMSRKETQGYIRHQLSVAGIDPTDFMTNDAIDTVHAASEGLPRLTNQIIDHAMVLAASNNQSPISASLIEEAWADLQQLPAPWHRGEERKQAAAIEFGSLDDSDDISEPVIEQTTPNYFTAFAPLSDDEAEEQESELEDTADESQKALAHEHDELLEVIDSAVDDNGSTCPTPGADEGSLDTDVEFAELEADAPLLIDISESDFCQATLPEPAGFADASQRKRSHEAESQDNDKFFRDRPTDERMLALEDEQAQYDSMGIWENDPPLSDQHSSPLEINSGSIKAYFSELEATDATPELNDSAGAEDDWQITIEVVTHPIELNCPSQNAGREACSRNGEECQIPVPGNLFGDDFEEEFPVTESGFDGSVAASRAPCPSEQADGSAARCAAAAAADSIAHASDTSELTADTTGPAQEGLQVDDQPDEVLVEITAELQSEPEQWAEEALTSDEFADGEAEAWSVDIVPTGVESEMALQQEIEDIVSQLNFSAFCVEPYSVEEISVEPNLRPSGVPPDSVRGGADEQVYLLHRAQPLGEENVFTQVAEYDDDRDMLVIEEDLPVSARAAEPSPTDKPPVKAAPYSQLFAKLRR